MQRYDTEDAVEIDAGFFMIAITGTVMILLAMFSVYLCSHRHQVSQPLPQKIIQKATLPIKAATTFLLYPVKFEYISGWFSSRRFHPILKRFLPHFGIDFAAKPGTPVETVADGVVVFAGRLPGDGNIIKIRHCNRYTTVYAHLSKIAVRSGEKVIKGEIIGNVGSTGLSTGPHLHYSLYDNGKSVDPIKTIKKMV